MAANKTQQASIGKWAQSSIDKFNQAMDRPNDKVDLPDLNLVDTWKPVASYSISPKEEARQELKKKQSANSLVSAPLSSAEKIEEGGTLQRPRVLDLSDADNDNIQNEIEAGDDTKRNETPLSGIVTRITGGDNTGAVEEGRVARKSAQGDAPAMLTFSESFLEGLDESPLSFVADAARGAEDNNFLTNFVDIKSDKDFENMSNPVDALSDDVNAINSWIGGLRREGAEENAEYRVRIGDYDYSEQEFEDLSEKMSTEAEFELASEPSSATNYAGYILSDGTAIKMSEFDNGTIEARVPSPGEEPDGYSDGQAYVIDYMTLDSGVTLNRDQVLEAMSNGPTLIDAAQATQQQRASLDPIQAYVVDDYGNKVYFNDMVGDSETYQSNAGFLNMNKLYPSAPTEDIGDIVPWLTDAALSTLPWLIPGWRELTTGAYLGASMEGYDPDTFDPRTYTYENRSMDDTQQQASMALPLVDNLTEYIGGFKPGTGLSALRNRTLPGRIIQGAVAEGLEEIPSGFVEQLKQDSLDNYAKNSEYNNRGELVYDDDTTNMDRLRNLGENLANNFIGGALLGGGLVTGGEAVNALANRKNKVEYDDTYRLSPELVEELERLSQLRR